MVEPKSLFSVTVWPKFFASKQTLFQTLIFLCCEAHGVSDRFISVPSEQTDKHSSCNSPPHRQRGQLDLLAVGTARVNLNNLLSYGWWSSPLHPGNRYRGEINTSSQDVNGFFLSNAVFLQFLMSFI